MSFAGLASLQPYDGQGDQTGDRTLGQMVECATKVRRTGCSLSRG